jgi:hypothetical protein
LVLPQFHVKLDYSFETIREMVFHVPRSQWQIKAGFFHKKVDFATSEADSRNLEIQRTLNTPESTPASQPPPQADTKSTPQEAKVSEAEQTQDEFLPLRRPRWTTKPVD